MRQTRISAWFTHILWMKQSILSTMRTGKKAAVTHKRYLEYVSYRYFFTVAPNVWFADITEHRVPTSHCFAGCHFAHLLLLTLVSKVYFFCPFLIIKEQFKMLQLGTCFPVGRVFHAGLLPQKCRKLKHRISEKNAWGYRRHLICHLLCLWNMYPLTSPITKLSCEHTYSVDGGTAGCSCRTEQVWCSPKLGRREGVWRRKLQVKDCLAIRLLHKSNSWLWTCK